MKKSVFICGISALVFGLVSCKSVRKDVKVSDASSVAIGDNSQNALDWEGYYSAILPCDDCGGIQLSVELLANGTYKMKQVYFGKEDSDYNGSGKLVWNNGGNSITIGEGLNTKMFMVGENALFLLDKDGNRMTGEQLDSYILAKADLNLIEKHWKLTELFGEPVNTPEGSKGAYIIFKKEDNRITGNSACNTFNGSYTLRPGNRISFSRSMSTMMMCAEMDTETKVYKVLEMTDNYVVNGDKLVLNKGRMAPLARFEAVY